ncbi:unnamed protein product [Pieris brassicae]|uniref:Uncharacterized protein n=1 Tax=Pieris brassicae TaxID=7116 RepID=A0A9P0TPE4_PIEBR|nr:unnamed protein product [Pieris brassicae]
MKTLVCIILILISRIFAKPTLEYLGAIEAVPPSVTLSPLSDSRIDGNGIHINPLTNPLFQVVLDESDNKRRVQRYRDIF